MKQIDLIGQKFGRLTVVDYTATGKNYKLQCKCDCGNTVFAFRSNLVSGRTKSCGCLAGIGESRALYRDAWHSLRDFVNTNPASELVAKKMDELDPEKFIRTNNTK